jgi:hypothetical protein
MIKNNIISQIERCHTTAEHTIKAVRAIAVYEILQEPQVYSKTLSAKAKWWDDRQKYNNGPSRIWFSKGRICIPYSAHGILPGEDGSITEIIHGPVSQNTSYFGLLGDHCDQMISLKPNSYVKIQIGKTNKAKLSKRILDDGKTGWDIHVELNLQYFAELFWTCGGIDTSQHHLIEEEHVEPHLAITFDLVGFAQVKPSQNSGYSE